MAAPQRKKRLDVRHAKQVFSVAPHVFQKNISERHELDALPHRIVDRAVEGGLVLLVRARMRDGHDAELEPGCTGLVFEELAADGVHGDPIEALVHRRDECYDLDVRSLAQLVERPRAVLPAAPPKPHALHEPSASATCRKFSRPQAARMSFSTMLHTAASRSILAWGMRNRRFQKGTPSSEISEPGASL